MLVGDTVKSTLDIGVYVQYIEYLVAAVDEVPNDAGIIPVHFSGEIALPGVPEVYLMATPLSNTPASHTV